MAHRHFKMHKPDGFLSQFIHNSRRRKRVLGELYDFPEKTMSIGRLDENSEGLLLLTTDGKMSHHITSRKVEKEYYVRVDGLITDEAVERMKAGIEIRTNNVIYKTKPCKARRIPNPNFPPRNKRIRDDAAHGPSSWVAITIREGKYKQVRKMTAVAGFPTLRLVRVRIGEVRLEEMKAGEVIEVKEFEV